MKTKTLAPILMLMLLMSIIYGVHLAEVAEANFVPGPPFIVIESPEENRLYATSSVWLNVTLRAFYDSDSWNVSRVVKCSLDGDENITIPVVYEGLDEDYFSIVTGSFLLSDLSDGSYSMTVYATYDFLEPWNLFYSDVKTVSFVIALAEQSPTPTPPNMGPTSPPSQELMLTQKQMEIILGVTVTVAVVGACLVLLIYFVKRK